MDNRKLRFVVNSLGIGGTEIHLSAVIPQLAQRGWNIDLLVLSDDLTLLNRFQHPNIQIFSLFQKYSKNLPRIIQSSLRFYYSSKMLINSFKENPSIPTHFFLPRPYMIGMLCAKIAKAKGPFLMSRRSLNNYQEKLFFIRFLEKILHNYCHIILGNSKAIQKQLIEMEGVPVEKTKVIYNGIDEQAFVEGDKISYREALGYNLSQFLIVCIANLKKEKGHADLLESLYIIKNQLPSDWRLLLVGEDRGLKHKLMQLSKQYNIMEHIDFIEDCKDPVPYIKAADIGVLASNEEGFSNAIVEMMVAGIPIVATDAGGNKEAIIHGESGLIVQINSPAQLAQGILELYGNKELRISYGRHGYNLYKANFTLLRCINFYEELYMSFYNK